MGQRDDQGILSQQDAEECWTLIINELAAGNPQRSIDKITGQLKTTMKSAESGESAETVDPFVKLNCHISLGTKGPIF
jgi:hypothetical protein